MRTDRNSGKAHRRSDARIEPAAKRGSGKALLLLTAAFAICSCVPPAPDHPPPAPPQEARQPPPTAPEQSSPSLIVAIPLPQSSPELATAARQNPKTCDGFASPGTVFARNPAHTLISYRLSKNGDISDVALFRSSGSDVLDRAAMACARTFHGRPFLVGGQRAEITLIGGVNWSSPWHGFLTFAKNGTPDTCSYKIYPTMSVRKHEQGDTKISYLIGSDGKVNNITVTSSSGSGALDSAATECVSAWRFFPATLDNRPIGIQETAEFSWRLR